MLPHKATLQTKCHCQSQGNLCQRPKDQPAASRSVRTPTAPISPAPRAGWRRVRVSSPISIKGISQLRVNIEAPCAAPPEARLPPQPEPNGTELPCCQLRPYLISASASCTKTAAATVVAWRGGRAPPRPRTQSPALSPVACPLHVLRRVLYVLVLHVLVLHVSFKGSAGGGTRVLGVGSKAALAADRAFSGVGLASRSPRAAAYLFLCPLNGCVGGGRPRV